MDLGQYCREGLGNTGVQKIGQKLAMCTSSPESPSYPELLKTKHVQQVKRDHSAPLLCSRETPDFFSGPVVTGQEEWV